MWNTRGKSVSQRTRVTFLSSDINLHPAPTFTMPRSLSYSSNSQQSLQPIMSIIGRQLLVICGPGFQYHDYRSQQPQIKYRSYMPAGEQRWRPSIEVLDESVAGPEETSLTWADFLRFRVLEDKTPFLNWRQLYSSQGHGKRPLIRDCYVTSGWDNCSKQQIRLPYSPKDPGTLRNLLNTWFPNSRDHITIIFESIPSYLPKVASPIQYDSNNYSGNVANLRERCSHFDFDEEYSDSKRISSDKPNIRRSYGLSQLPSSPLLLHQTSILATSTNQIADPTSDNQLLNTCHREAANIKLLSVSSSSLISVGKRISTTLNIPTNMVLVGVRPGTSRPVLATELSQSSLSSPLRISSSPKLPNAHQSRGSKSPSFKIGFTSCSPIDSMFIILFVTSYWLLGYFNKVGLRLWPLPSSVINCFNYLT